MMVKRKVLTVFLMLAAVPVRGCGDSLDANAVPDPEQQVTLTVWHNYYGTGKEAFDALAAEFNDTTGREQGIYVTGLQKDIRDTADMFMTMERRETNQSGSDDAPDILAVDGETAWQLYDGGYLAELTEYFTEAEQSDYLEAAVRSGRIIPRGQSARPGSDKATGVFLIFPVAGAIDVLMLNQTDWEVFAAETGASLADLETMEGLTETARRYYEWTDALTPDIPADGRAFYGRDELAGLFMAGAGQLGTDLFAVEGGPAALQAEQLMRRIWDCYYTPYIKGYFTSFCRFRSDDMKSGSIIAFSTSSAGAIYFPEEVENNETSYPIRCQILPEPLFAGGDPYRLWQSEGMAVAKGTPAEEYAAAVFLKWFADRENGAALGCISGRLPAAKAAFNTMSLDKVIAARKLTVSPRIYQAMITALESARNRSGDYLLGGVESFAGSAAAKAVLETHLQEKAVRDRETVIVRIGTGMSLEEAAADLLTEEAFRQWHQDFAAALEEAMAGAE